MVPYFGDYELLKKIAAGGMALAKKPGHPYGSADELER